MQVTKRPGLNHERLPLGSTERRDAWWIGPLVTALVLSIAGGYMTWAAFQNGHYYVAPYLSPLYSPDLKAYVPAWLSPALLILVFPLGFRATCYYYRKAYYRAFFFDPVGCAVGEGKEGGYSGERSFPFILQNMHRYFLYAALLILIVLWKDVVEAFMFPTADGHHAFGVGVGTIVLLVNTALLTGYTFGCHSLRHILGGKLDCWSCQEFGLQRHKAWKGATWFNKLHMNFAWASLISVAFADLYVRMVSMGIWQDFRIVFGA